MVPNTNRRELAWRVFAKEFNSATTVIPGEEQYAPTYVLSPLGALINRVYLTGVLTECENAGTELEPLWRGRVSDPTDVFYISAGQFQPKAARMLSELEVPALVGISGKARTYSPDENTTYVSVRVEFIKPITQENRDYWVIEACSSLQYRLGAIRESQNMEPPDINKLVSLGYSKKVATGIIEAVSRFGEIDTESFSELLNTVLNELTYDTSMDVTVVKGGAHDVGGSGSSGPGHEILHEMQNKGSHTSDFNVISEPTNNIHKDENQSQSTDSTNDSDADTDSTHDPAISEQLVLEIIKTLAEESTDGVEYSEVSANAMDHGFNKELLEECIGSLIDKGVIYEPSIGLFKPV